MSENLVAYFDKKKQIHKVLTEDLNDLVKGTTVFGYVTPENAKKDLNEISDSDIAWLDIDYK